MKTMKRIATLLLALVLILGLATTAFAQTITITPPEGATGTNTYKIYKVFDANADGTKIAYQVMESKKDVVLPTGFELDANGNVKYSGANTELTKPEIDAIAAYVANDKPVDTVETTGTTAGVSIDLPAGYYYITTGSLVVVSSTINGNTTVSGQ